MVNGTWWNSLSSPAANQKAKYVVQRKLAAHLTRQRSLVIFSNNCCIWILWIRRGCEWSFWAQCIGYTSRDLPERCLHSFFGIIQEMNYAEDYR
jgi:hypothetical protein